MDADDDTCFDGLEENIVGTVSDGIAGNGVTTVDANGLVIGVTYSVPSNSVWQDPTIHECTCNAHAPLISKDPIPVD